MKTTIKEIGISMDAVSVSDPAKVANKEYFLLSPVSQGRNSGESLSSMAPVKGAMVNGSPKLPKEVLPASSLQSDPFFQAERQNQNKKQRA